MRVETCPKSFSADDWNSKHNKTVMKYGENIVEKLFGENEINELTEFAKRLAA